MCLGISLHCKDKRRIPAPAVGSGHAHPALKQIQGGLTSHAAAFGDVVGACIRGAGAGVHDDNFEWGKCVTDALEFSLDVLCGRDVAVRKMAEVELHAGLETPFKRHLVDGNGTLAVIHGGGEMPGCIEMCRAVC